MKNAILAEREAKIDKLIHSGLLGNDVTEFFGDPLWSSLRAYLIGGAIRDAIEDRSPRDLDIMIVNNDKGVIERMISKYKIPYKRNTFNGYKLFLQNISIDIWLIEDHYVFKKHIYEPKASNIKRATLLNYDSLIYDIYRKKLNTTNYDKCVKERTIDFVGKKEITENNPNPILSLVKMLEIEKNNDYTMSSRVNDYIADIYNHNGEKLWILLSTEYYRHYQEKLKTELLSFFKQQVMLAIRDNFVRTHTKNYICGQYNIFDYILPIKEQS